MRVRPRRARGGGGRREGGREGWNEERRWRRGRMDMQDEVRNDHQIFSD